MSIDFTDIDLYKEVALKYYSSREEGDPDFSLDYLNCDFEVNSQNPIRLIWSQREEEYTRGLISLFNGFTGQLYRLYLLEKIICKYSDNEQIKLRFEFTRIPLYYCLHKPSEYRNRLQYCCIHLCHQANLIVQSGYKDELPEDRKLEFKHLKEKSGNWNTADGLLEALGLIGNKSSEFTESINDYRNKNQHRLPPAIEMGLTRNIIRTEIVDDDSISRILRTFSSEVNIEPGTKGIRYELGYMPPLRNRDMIPVLIKQGEAMREAFYRYWDLVKEQDGAINAVEMQHKDLSEGE